MTTVEGVILIPPMLRCTNAQIYLATGGGGLYIYLEGCNAAILELLYANSHKDRDLPSRGVIVCFHTIGLGTAGRAESVCHTTRPSGSCDAAECERNACTAAATDRSASLSHHHSK